MGDRQWRPTLARLGYNLIIHLLIPAAILHFLWRSRREAGYRRHLGERLALGAPPPPLPDLWIHAVSLGEMRVAGTLLRALAASRPTLRLLLTTVTPAGRTEAERMRAQGLPLEVRYLPLDSPVLMRRFITRVRPRVLVLIETELWPNLLRQGHLAGLPVVLVNARLSPALRATYRRFRLLYGPLLGTIEWIAAQGPGDAREFRDLGAGRVEVTGNLKFDLPPVPPAPALERAQLASGQLWLAGSTHPGEEALVLDVHHRLQATGRGARIQLLLAPRHPARSSEVIALARAEGFSVIARSAIGTAGTSADVIVLDTLGELAALYALADAAFVGGSLVAQGGQNPLEPIAAGCPVVIGPDTRNFADMIEQLRDAGALLQVADADDLLQALERLLGDPGAGRAQVARAREVVAANSGATAHTLQLLEPLLPGPQDATGHTTRALHDAR
ncbi:3-deoxy-D-manno-octulosonic acid transferase [Thioalkalivibrio sp.]|uniref:3-deoxy-D-manno-octulosonic acid transferase n=1 Tax=Thioalkalivibrio sp. TaxID=2093813 RepID=UPI00356175B0